MTEEHSRELLALLRQIALDLAAIRKLQEAAEHRELTTARPVEIYGGRE